MGVSLRRLERDPCVWAVSVPLALFSLRKSSSCRDLIVQAHRVGDQHGGHGAVKGDVRALRAQHADLLPVRAMAGCASRSEPVEVPRRRPPRFIAAAAAGRGWAEDAAQRDDAAVALPVRVPVPEKPQLPHCRAGPGLDCFGWDDPPLGFRFPRGKVLAPVNSARPRERRVKVRRVAADPTCYLVREVRRLQAPEAVGGCWPLPGPPDRLDLPPNLLGYPAAVSLGAEIERIVQVIQPPRARHVEPIVALGASPITGNEIAVCKRGVIDRGLGPVHESHRGDRRYGRELA